MNRDAVAETASEGHCQGRVLPQAPSLVVAVSHFPFEQGTLLLRARNLACSPDWRLNLYSDSIPGLEGLSRAVRTEDHPAVFAQLFLSTPTLNV